jgi:type I restriction enzyme S subunit
MRLKDVARVDAGQSPPSNEVRDLAEGLPFLQGNAEFGHRFPEPRYECSSTPKRVRAGDVLLSVRAPVGAINIADQAYGIGRGLASIRALYADSEFIWWWLHSQRPALDAVSTGTTYRAVTAEDVANLPFPQLDLDRQRRIADFLDAETARIDGLAAARQRMRELLLLRRERTVEQIIGLDACPPMIPLKYVVQSVSVGIVITPANWYVDEGGIPALRGLNVQPGRIDGSNMVQISHEGHRENMKSRLSAGDVVVVRTGQAGAAAVVPAKLDGSNCIDLLIIRPGKKTDSSFLTHYLNSFYVRDKITEHSVGSIQAHFNVASMKNLEFPNIELAEQQRRAARLDELIGELDLLDSQLEAQLERLTERRQALITAAVTGGISV